MVRSFINQASAPLGIRNNNPGNLRTGARWAGRTSLGSTSGFVQFVDFSYGVRAMLLLLSNKIAGGMNTVRKLIGSWAPPSENNTGAYVASVSRKLGVGPDTPITASRATLSALAQAITAHENGNAWQINAEEMAKAFALLPGRTIKRLGTAAAGSGLVVFLGIGLYFLLKP